MQSALFQIRSASKSDGDAVFGLFEQVQSLHAQAEPAFFRQPERDDFFEAFFDSVLKDPEQYLVLACIDEQPVGYNQYFIGSRPKNLYQPERRFAYIHQLVVTETYRKSGCATALIDYVKEDAKKQDVTLLGIDFWSFNSAARGCFTKAGFEVNQEHMWLKL